MTAARRMDHRERAPGRAPPRGRLLLTPVVSQAASLEPRRRAQRVHCSTGAALRRRRAACRGRVVTIHALHPPAGPQYLSEAGSVYAARARTATHRAAVSPCPRCPSETCSSACRIAHPRDPQRDSNYSFWSRQVRNTGTRCESAIQPTAAREHQSAEESRRPYRGVSSAAAGAFAKDAELLIIGDEISNNANRCAARCTGRSPQARALLRLPRTRRSWRALPPGGRVFVFPSLYEGFGAAAARGHGRTVHW